MLVDDKDSWAEEIPYEPDEFKGVISSAAEGIIVYDLELRHVVWNPFMEKLTGLASEKVLGKQALELFPHLREFGVEELLRQALTGEITRSVDIPYHIPQTGKFSWVVGTYGPYYNSEGEIIGVIGVIHDISERKQAEEALRQSEERYALAILGANDGLWDWNLETNEIYFSPRWKSMLGYKENEIGNNPDEWFNRVHPQDLDRIKIHIISHLQGLTPRFENEHRMLHKDKTYRWMLSRGLAVRDASGKAYRIAGSQTDLTAHKVAEAQLLHDAFYDGLTGLPNRALFLDHIGRLIKRGKRQRDYLFAVLFLDLDRFKIINEGLGHVMGDRLLIAIARRLEKCLRPSDTIARLGGDEFAILLDDIKDANDATRIVERLQKELARSFDLSGQEAFVTASIGIALSTKGYEHPEDLLRDADMAMYRAKTLGRARHEIFDVTMQSRALGLLQLESYLRRAVEREEFQIHYQPIVSLESGKIIGSEALVRWQHPQRGLVSPAEFIPLAEETGLIIPLGEWVLRTVCKQNKAWKDAGFPPLYISVNLSARQFKQKNLTEMITQILKDLNLDPQLLKLELTESIVMENADATIKILKELKELGIQLSIDDFGTGYSSLSYLKRFPIDTLKIDQSFVRNIATDPNDAAITTAVITLAHNLKLRVIAEGLEEEEQLVFLRSQQCDEIQGYLLSRPLPVEAFTELLREGLNLWPNIKPV